MQNGSLVRGAASRVSTELSGKGLTVVEVTSTPDQGSHHKTTIIDYTNGQKKHTLDALVKTLGLDPSVVTQADPESAPLSATDQKAIDIAVIVGDDNKK